MQNETSGWPDTIESLRSSLARTGISQAGVDALLSSTRPALMLATELADEDTIPTGATKIGGRPDLPAGMGWPERPAYPHGADLAKAALDGAARFHADAGIAPPWMDAAQGAELLAENVRQKAETRAFMKTLGVDDADLEAAFSYDFSAEDCAAVAREARAKASAATSRFPLAFLGQFDLAVLSQADGFDPALPRSGRLYLFYDLLLLPPSYAPGSRIGLRVFHDTSAADTLIRADMPAQLEEIVDLAGVTLLPSRATVSAAFTVAAGDALSDEDQSDLQDWLSEVAGWPGTGHAGAHQLGGWPREIQSSMVGTAALASNGIDVGTSEAWQTPEVKRLLEDAGAWRLLFQLGSDERIGNMLPGALNVLLRDEDVAAAHFDRAWAVYEQS